MIENCRRLKTYDELTAGERPEIIAIKALRELVNEHSALEEIVEKFQQYLKGKQE
jgi:hypothetical protein